VVSIFNPYFDAESCILKPWHVYKRGYGRGICKIRDKPCNTRHIVCKAPCILSYLSDGFYISEAVNYSYKELIPNPLKLFSFFLTGYSVIKLKYCSFNSFLPLLRFSFSLLLPSIVSPWKLSNSSIVFLRIDFSTGRG